MKLELKHLASYLPYGLDFTHYDDKRLCTSRMRGIKILNKAIYINDYRISEYKQFKPILRPLSDLYKEIILDNIICYPYSILKISLDMAMNFNDYDFNDLPYKVIKQMIEWHFDVFGLIEQNLAIDINKVGGL